MFDDWMSFPFRGFGSDVDRKLYGKHAANLMKTDLKEHDEGYLSRCYIAFILISLSWLYKALIYRLFVFWRPWERYSLGDIPYLRRKRRIK